ncbi:L-fucose mutarotase [Paenibacillus methanolicus]|uniref:L-fucose mutarotase n=1 Tax=Paenibacillus methanolicus TaxID=582686 RepID=A0A5S5BVH8_9BACL|nr:L-fucose mutarotase [Paenibacillus methanolicus]TYP70192.1 L-fucose mutarotase [Paenibacillus methanolicus]
MLNGIPSILSPDLLKTLMEMGHGDEIVLADANFPAVSCARRIIRADGHPIPALLDAILTLMPLDEYVDLPVLLMEKVAGDTVETPIWATYGTIIAERAGADIAVGFLERFAFYERARAAYAIVATGERAQYGNVILKKGVIREK